MKQYRIVDVQTEKIGSDPQIVEALSPERAAAIALGVELLRSGSMSDLRARVYYQVPGEPECMVRLYTKAADRRYTL